MPARDSSTDCHATIQRRRIDKAPGNVSGVADPASEIKRVLSFLDEPFDEACLSPESQATESDAKFPGEYSKENHVAYRMWQVSQPIMDRTSAWRAELTEEDLEQINNELADQLGQYGYV